jgi:hypothetical protein
VCIGNVLAHTLDYPQTNHFISTTELNKAMELLNFTSQDMTDYVERMKLNWDLVNSLLRS